MAVEWRKLPRLECDVCGAIWSPRNPFTRSDDDLPKVCAKCGSKKWNKDSED